MKDKWNKTLEKYSDEVQESFCILPFVHTFLNTEGDVFPCCISWDAERGNLVGYVKDESLEDLFNSPKMKQLRLDFINGKRRPDVCVRCYNSEDNGFPAGRHGNNHDLQHMIEDVISATQEDGYLDPKLKSWDIRFSNLCNLKCRSCGDIYSTTWAKEDADFGINRGQQEFKAYEGEDPLKNQYDNVEKIYFAGGEPLIMPEHYNTLTQIIKKGRAKKVRLVYNTNMTKLNYNNNYLVDYWKEFKQVTLGLSIDNFGDRANYIRHGSVKWHKIENNIKQLAEYSKQPNSNMDYFFSPTVSILNAYTLTDLHRHFYEDGMMTGIDDLLFNILYHPAELSFNILPDYLKQEIQDKIKLHIEWIKDNGGTSRSIDQFNSFSDCLNEKIDDPEKNIKQFIRRTKELDARRNESFPDTFPEYAEWWNTITKNTIDVVNL
jgi:organic radical activating enzyme